jgi:hypothetical protein
MRCDKFCAGKANKAKPIANGSQLANRSSSEKSRKYSADGMLKSPQLKTF